jgi:hypothetical protein
MKFGAVPLDQAEGKILGHNIAGPDGRRALRKGRPLSADDLAALHALGRGLVYVAEMMPDDVHEDLAARRVAKAIMGSGLRLSGPSSGRANLLAETPGLLRVDRETVIQVNDCEGITLATAQPGFVRARQISATVKIIPFAVPENLLRRAEDIAAAQRPAIHVDPLPAQPVGLVLAGSASIRERLTADFAPLVERVEALGSRVACTEYVSVEGDEAEAELARTIAQLREMGMSMVILAGETAIMDRQDIAPRAVERAGGHVETLGAPVDPGNLLMLAYLDSVPIVGAPGCARSRKPNVVDWLLPRLLAGDRLTRADIAALGYGGLLDDVPERPQPREQQ